MIFNQIKTVILLASLSGILLLLGNYFGGMAGVQIAFVIALIMNGVSYFFSDTIVLKMYNAQPLDQTKFAWLYQIVDELRQEMGIPMPKLWLVDTPMANAFATGRNPSHASVAVTTGILQILNHEELRGVLAHELSHVKNRDILIGSVAATLATAIGYLASMMQHMAFWQSMSGGRSNDDKKSANPIAMIFIAILMPIAASLIQLAISRSREYQADDSGAHHCHDPLALASALEKLQNNIPDAHLNNNDTARATTAPLFIVNPFSGGLLSSLFATHPPMADRIKRLQALSQKMR